MMVAKWTFTVMAFAWWIVALLARIADVHDGEAHTNFLVSFGFACVLWKMDSE